VLCVLGGVAFKYTVWEKGGVTRSKMPHGVESAHRLVFGALLDLGAGLFSEVALQPPRIRGVLYALAVLVYGCLMEIGHWIN
jgi:hypothetical protein